MQNLHRSVLQLVKKNTSGHVKFKTRLKYIQWSTTYIKRGLQVKLTV